MSEQERPSVEEIIEICREVDGKKEEKESKDE